MTRATLEVLSAGMFATVQDEGRRGLTHLGVSPGGAADLQALRIGNRLVGNVPHAAAVEMTISGGSFRCLRATWVAITGAECEVTVDLQPMALWYAFPLRAGETLRVGSLREGARAYLSVSGGIDSPFVLGSRSSSRAMESGDILSIANDVASAPGYRRAGIDVRFLYRELDFLRVTRGPQWEWFTADARRDFLANEFNVTTEADRKGVRLQGAEIATSNRSEMVTEGISNGAIQVPSNGQPLILFCEQRTTGGYPKIANVIRADLYKVGQLRPGAKIRFEEVDLESAWRLNREREQLWRRPLI